ncbi:MAG: glycosyltransferase family 9 protein, partial [Candidatus Omnitrophota bacterium]
ELEDAHLEIWPDKDDEEYIEKFLEANWAVDDKLIGINLGASFKWQTKIWPVEYISILAQKISQKGMRLVITGTQEDLELLEPIKDSLDKTKSIIACGKTSINQLACLIKRCRVFISSDSAPLHVASSVGVACIALFGPTDPKRHMSYNQNSIVITKELKCSPCYKPKCKTRDCLKQITPEEVFEKIQELLFKNQ